MKWKAKKIDDATFYIENGEKSEQVRSAHCKCCALVTVVQMHGGLADLRGLHSYGPCYQFLAVCQRQQANEEEGDDR